VQAQDQTAVNFTVTTFRGSAHMIITLVLVRIAKIIATPIPEIFHFQKKNVKSDFFAPRKSFLRSFFDRISALNKNFFRGAPPDDEIFNRVGKNRAM
jgi:hypothetical protein